MDLQNGNLLNKIGMRIEVVDPELNIIRSSMVIDARLTEIRVVFDGSIGNGTKDNSIYIIKSKNGVIDEPVDSSMLRKR